MEVLKTEGLCMSFGGVLALCKVSLRVEKGERLVIIGPNGAGKTTLFSVLDGQLKATAGQIYFFGQEITHVPGYRRAHRGISRSFQLTTLFMNLTILENTLLALQGTKQSRFQILRPITAYKHLYNKAQALLDPMELWEKRNDQVHAISYGDQRKLEIALGLASEPRLLLLDEPSTGLTSAERADVTSRIRNLGADITVIVATHDMDLAFGVAQRIIVLHHGEIVTVGTPEEIRADPKTREIYLGEEGIRHA